MLVALGALVVGVGAVVHVWAADVGQTIAVLGMLVLLPAALLQAVIGMIDGVRDHDQLGESRSAVAGLLGVVAVVACVLVAVAVGL
jgi:succinate dehydrogenase hydrophobic anchor subunit